MQEKHSTKSYNSLSLTCCSLRLRTLFVIICMTLRESVKKAIVNICHKPDIWAVPKLYPAATAAETGLYQLKQGRAQVESHNFSALTSSAEQ